MKLQFNFIHGLIVLLLAIGNTSAFAADNILTNKAGMTLYTFDNDAKATSNCYDGCAVKWPPFMATSNAKAKDGYSIITRKDGSKQWAYDDKPLYTWVGDTKKGDTKGDGVGGVWHVAIEKASSYSYAY